ncbi:MAG: HAD-IA family hydrolase [Candidatus Dormiibacterota bacterium]
MAADPTPHLLRPLDTAVDAVIFDYDGTLVATRFADEAAVTELIAADPSAAASAPVFWDHDGEPLLVRIERAWPGRAAEVLPLFERQAGPRSCPGVQPMLRSLHRRGLLMAVVSSRRCAALDAGLAATGLRHYFQLVVGLEDVTEPKPSPEGLIQAMEGLKARPERTIYVGDNLLDIEAGRRAGVTVWRAAWCLPPLSPDGVVELRTPTEVGRRLDRMRSSRGVRARLRVERPSPGQATA